LSGDGLPTGLASSIISVVTGLLIFFYDTFKQRLVATGGGVYRIRFAEPPPLHSAAVAVFVVHQLYRINHSKFAQLFAKDKILEGWPNINPALHRANQKSGYRHPVRPDTGFTVRLDTGYQDGFCCSKLKGLKRTVS
jgi:hypothetical protein